MFRNRYHLQLILMNFIVMMIVGFCGYFAERANGASPQDADNFYKNAKLEATPVTFPNLYKMEMSGILFLPENFNKNDKYPAIIVGHPMGAVKEQSAVLYAQKMAEHGFVTLAMDLAFWGGSQGQPRNAVSPDMYAETFSAAVDYLDMLPFVDKKEIGIIGICGSGCFALSAGKIDPRLKAIATVSMYNATVEKYNMGNSRKDASQETQIRKDQAQLLEEAAKQRDAEFSGQSPALTSGTLNELTPDANPVQREFYDFYRTDRGKVVPPGVNWETTTHPTLSSFVKFMNFYPFNDLDAISPRPILIITGENAFSRNFNEEAYKRAAEPKELVVVPNAGHVDLYDRASLIPFDKLANFFKTNLK